MTKKISIVLSIVAAILLVGCIVVYTTKDRTAPVINIPGTEVTYQEGDEYDDLLEGVTAWDSKDGDVTEDVRIYSVAVTDNGRKAVVTYAVYDGSANLAKASRTVGYKMK